MAEVPKDEENWEELKGAEQKLQKLQNVQGILELQSSQDEELIIKTLV